MVVLAALAACDECGKSEAPDAGPVDAGPVVFSERLAAYAPVPFVRLTAAGAEFIETRRQAGDTAAPFGRITAFHGQMGMFVRALSYMLAHGADGMRQASEDAVLNANYIRAGLADLMSQPFGNRPCMHEALFDDDKTGPFRIAIVAAATLVTSASVATSGIIGWVGLVVPHLARALVGPDFPRLIPTAALLGGGYLLFIDTLARTAAPVEIPLGILTAVIGTPFFIWLLAGMQRNWS